jgi:hypothetical protein
MLGRCRNPNTKSYKYYGERGISVCDRWSEYVNFKSDMEPGYKAGLQLDRIDVNGNYEPGNCRWATKKEQMRNTRRNVFLTFAGKTQTMVEWAEEVGISYHVIQNRRKAMWPIGRMLTEPVHNNGGHRAA